jgi:hypothetical protein
MINNGRLELVILPGGGHIAAVRPVGEADHNPLWSPSWASVEPGRFQAKRDSEVYGGPPEGRLLASIMGHNLCLDLFGGPSPAEMAAGMSAHGEAPVATWKPTSMNAGGRGCRLTMRAALPEARLLVQRSIKLSRGQGLVGVEETVLNQGGWDRPVMWCQHVSLGPPFLDRKRTLFDLSGDVGRTFPATFDSQQKLKKDMSFDWPSAPNLRGGKSVDLRTMRPSGDYGDFVAVRMDPSQSHAWFTAVRPDLGLLFGYIFRRADFPWLGIWDQAFSRKDPPWNGQSLVRGMEFSTSPFPTSKKAALEMGSLEGQPTVRWIPARSREKARYGIFMIQTDKNLAEGVRNIVPDAKGAWTAELGDPAAGSVRLGRMKLDD